MQVTVSVHGRYHAFELARGLFDRGILARLLTTYPGLAVHRVIGPDIPVRTAPLLELRRRLYDRTGWGGKPDLSIARQFGRFAGQNLPDGSDLLVGWSSATLEAIGPAQARGMKVVIERGSTHIAVQSQVLKEAYRRCGLACQPTDPEMIEREEREYTAADMITVPSRHAARSFVDRGIAADRLLVNAPGVDLTRTAGPINRPESRTPVILFAGGVGVRKGVPWLLQAFQKLRGRAQLHLYGPIEPGFAEVLQKYRSDGLVIHGPVSSGQLARAYAGADIFCLPSVEEGFGMVVPEAMAAGLPVVLSDAVGACDVMTDDQEGLIVPAMDENALFEALDVLAGDPGRRRKMAAAAVRRVTDGCTWEAYTERAVRGYSAVLARSAR